MHQTKALGPLLLALGACSGEKPLEPRPVESWDVSFEGASHRLSALESSDRDTPRITPVDNEPDIRNQLTELKRGLLSLAAATGAILEQHEAEGTVPSSKAEVALHLTEQLESQAAEFRRFLAREKYPDEMQDTTLYICGTGLPRVQVVYGKDNTRAEEVAFKVANSSEIALNSIILLENTEGYLSRRAAQEASPKAEWDRESYTQKTWEALRKIERNVEVIGYYMRDVQD